MPEPDTRDRRQVHGARLVLLWTLTRLLTLVLLLGPESRSVGDVIYFTRTLRHLGDTGFAGAMPEYPLPAVVAIMVPWLLAWAVGHVGAYGFVFIALMLLTDLVFTWALTRAGRMSGASVGLTTWLAVGPVMGGLAYVRFDILPGVLVGLAILVLSTRPRVAAALVAMATSIKLWPVLLVPGVLVGGTRRLGRAATVGAIGLVAAGLTVTLGGWDRLWSPFVYQSARGLQIESVTATPVMTRFWADPHGYEIFYSKYKAYEVTGPGVGTALDVATVLLVAYACLVLVMWWRLSRLGESVTSDAVVWATLALTLGFMCASKVLSPQYLLWLLPGCCAGLTVVTGVRSLLRWSVVLGAAAALSHLLYPALYTSLAVHGGHTWIAVLVLALRNVLLVALLVWSLREAWAATRRPRGLLAAGARDWPGVTATRVV